MNSPLVSVVCLCYNHERFVREAILSVVNQTYPAVELIVVDDCSTDGSVRLIKETISNHPNIQFLELARNVGNCAAFNKALKLAKGEFVIDFATDDVMVPGRIERQINHFQKLDSLYGVVFTDADYIDSSGKFIRNHTNHLLKKNLIRTIPEGFIFREVLVRYFICSPTMMVRKTVLDQLQGYDEALAYEDFDFWVRASRNYRFAFLNEVLTKVRQTATSMSSTWYVQGDKQLHSTFLVCEKAVSLCRDDGDKQALLTRIRYEFKQASFSGNKTEAKLFAELEKRMGNHQWQFFLISFLTWLPLPWSWLRRKYHRLRYS